MTKGAKIAIGCVAALAVSIVVVVLVLAGMAYWAKNKFEGVVADANKVEELKAQADRNPFTAPADGIIGEDQLLRFLQVRKQIFGAYEKHRPEFERLSGQKQAGLADMGKAVGLVSELRLAHAQALADAQMNSEEYAFMVGAVYQSAWAATIADSAGTTTAREAFDKASQEAEQALEKAREEAKRQGIELPPEMDGVGEAIRSGADSVPAIDVPPQTIELFKKYEAEIKQYAMNGLELFGL